MTEKIYINDKESVTFNIPEEGNIASFMSGGADSSIMCYILAHLVKKHGLKTKIFPMTAEMLARPYNLKCSSAVLNKITELTGFEFDLHLCYYIPDHLQKYSDQQKEERHATYTRTMAHRYSISAIFNGLTANPDIRFFPDRKESHRQVCRDDLSWRQKKESQKGLEVPFIHIDKKGVAALYDLFSRREDLFPLTRSCEAELQETDFFTKDCFEVRSKGNECWWCRERAYGFDL